MKQLTTKAIILSRTDYGEADRILTLLTLDQGKLRLLARGVRRVKSKLAGGIELFSVSHITFIQGRGEIGTLTSTRLDTYYGHIVQDLDRTMLGYELIKMLNKATEDEPGQEYFDLLQQTFEVLDNPSVPLPIIRLWFTAQLLRLNGHTPNLQTDASGNKLSAEQVYHFDLERMVFAPASNGSYTPDHVKMLRLAFARHHPASLSRITSTLDLCESLVPLVQAMHNHAE